MQKHMSAATCSTAHIPYCWWIAPMETGAFFAADFITRMCQTIESLASGMSSNQTERCWNFTICPVNGKQNVKPKVRIGFALRWENRRHREVSATTRPHRELKYGWGYKMSYESQGIADGRAPDAKVNQPSRWPLIFALGVVVVTALLSIGLEYSASSFYGDSGSFITAVVFPGLLGYIAIGGNSPAVRLRIEAGILCFL